MERNADGLREVIGRNYKSVYKEIKAMKPGDTFEMPDGHIIRCITLTRNYALRERRTRHRDLRNADFRAQFRM